MTNVSESFYLQDGGKNQLAYRYGTKLRRCVGYLSHMSTAVAVRDPDTQERPQNVVAETLNVGRVGAEQRELSGGDLTVVLTGGIAADVFVQSTMPALRVTSYRLHVKVLRHTRNKRAWSFRRPNSQPISWLGTEESKRNTTQKFSVI